MVVDRTGMVLLALGIVGISWRRFRARLAQLARSTFTAQDVTRIREPYVGQPAVRDAASISTAQMSRVMEQFQPPTDVLVVRWLP